MRLLFISTNFPDVVCGIGDYTYFLSSEIAKTNTLDVFILTSDKKIIQRSATLRIFPKVKQWNVFALPTIISSIRDISPHYIIIQYSPYAFHNFGIPFWLLLLALWLLINKIKLITTFHEVAIKIDFHPRNIIVGFLQRLVARLLAFMSLKVVVTAAYRKNMFFPCTNNIIDIPIGSNILPLVIKEEEKNNLRNSLGLKNKIVISTFGTFAAYRKHDLILQAMKNISIRHKFDKFCILFIGSSSNSNDKASQVLTKKIRELDLLPFVKFSGYLTSENVFQYLSITDIFFMLNTDSIHGITTKSSSVAAAYAAGLPILSTKGPDDAFFKQGENIFYAKSQSVEDLEEALWTLIEDEKLRGKLSRGAHDTFKNELDWSVLAKKYNKVFTV